jgi:hypothetical protein
MPVGPELVGKDYWLPKDMPLRLSSAAVESVFSKLALVLGGYDLPRS